MRSFLILLILLIALSSCEENRPCLREKKAQTIHINFIYSPFSVDPRKGTDPVTTATNYMLYEGLTRLEPDGTVSLALAEEVKISRDQTEYIFLLKKSRWSDGSPLTAYHFESSWKKGLSPKFPGRATHLLFPIKNAEEAKTGKCSPDEIGVEAIDEQTLLVRLKRPTPYFLQLTAYPTYFPTPHNGDEVPYPKQQTTLVTNGPFRLVSWNSSHEIIAIKNPWYWNAKEVKLDEIHATIIPDEATALELFDQGGLDYIGGLTSPLPLNAVPTLKKTNRLHLKPIAGTNFSIFNVNTFPFNNIHIRKAFSYAVDKEAIIHNISQMFDDIAPGLVPQIFKENGVVVSETFNRNMALHHFNKGLQELGITRKDFPTVTYSYFSSEMQRNLALALQSQWQKTLDINVKIEGQELKSHLVKLHNYQFEIGQMSWIGQYHDPMCFLERFATKTSYRNYCGWENQHYHELLEHSFYKKNNDRMKCLNDAEQILMNEMPIIPLYHFHLVYIKNPHLKELSISPTGNIQFHKAYLDCSP